MEEAPFGRFHWYMSWCTSGGPFIDGYILGIIALALTPMTDDLGLSPAMQAAIAAASLIGLFFGSLLFGRLTDLIGRRVMYIINLAVFVVASLLLVGAGQGWQVLALRFVLGLAIGADYPIATSLLAEFLPRRQRGTLLAALIGAFWAGYAISFIVGWLMIDVGGLGWRLTLASSAIPAIAVLLLRANAPESPMWLAQRGKRDKAMAIVRERIGARFTLPDPDSDAAGGAASGWREVFRSGYGRRLFFVSLFWACQVCCQYAIFTYQPELLSTLGVENGNLGTVVISLFFIIGVIPGIFLVEPLGRRPVLLATFVGGALALGLLAGLPPLPAALTVVGFGLVGAFNAGGSVLQWVYPNELFPTGIRATAVGIAAAMSRLGAAIGVYAVPFLRGSLGLSGLLWVFAGVCVLGLVVSIPMAPETRGKGIADTSSGDAASA